MSCAEIATLREENERLREENSAYLRRLEGLFASDKALSDRVAELEAALRLWDEWHTDNCCAPHDPDKASPPPLSETYAALEKR